MAQAATPLKDVGAFLLHAPLYASFELSSDLEALSALVGRRFNTAQRRERFDGFCPYCKQDTTFTLRGSHDSTIGSKAISELLNLDRISHFDVTILCTRRDHPLYFFLRQQKSLMFKIGQYPSVHDLAVDEMRSRYRAVLKGENWSELYKAVGLAAHGEGIGSFVYLRRVLERLVQNRFDELKASQRWEDGEFRQLRMEERVEFLKDYLPEYLVSIRRIYSIFSRGIHELDNDQCLRFFDVGKQSIMMILQDDLEKKKALETRKALSEAVANFAPDPDDTTETKDDPPV